MNRRIETLRGFACVLLVLYHVIGLDAASGLRIPDGPLRWFNDGLAYLRMPLFTFLSGMVYGLRPFKGDSRRFIVGKVRRLLVPMLVVGTIFALAQSAVPGANTTVSNWWLLHVEPVAHFWFVEALFWVFMLIWLLERQRLISTPAGLGVAWLISVVVYLAMRGPTSFAIADALYLLPYFLSGLAMTRFDLWTSLSANRTAQLVLLSLAVLAIWMLGPPVPSPDRRTFWMLIAGVALCCLCLAPRIEIGWLARIGTYSYAIYLFHVFFTAASRIALERIRLPFLALEIPAGLLAGLFGPIVIHELAIRHRWSAFLFLGKSVPVRAQPVPSVPTGEDPSSGAPSAR